MTKIRKALFPVGGLGTRFLPATKSMPKEMLTIIDKPLIQYAVEEAIAAGIEELIFVTGRGKTAIQDHFDISYELNSELEKRHDDEAIKHIDKMVFEPGKICYIRQQMPLGLGHAVWCARHFIGEEPFAVILADDLVLGDPPCLKQMIDHYRPGTNMVAIQEIPRKDTTKYGIIDYESMNGRELKARSIVEKPSPEQAPSTKAVSGRYILHPEIFHHLSALSCGHGNEIQLTDAIQQSIETVPLWGYEFAGERFDCGSKEGLLAANVAYALQRPDMKYTMEKVILHHASLLNKQGNCT